MTSKQSLKAKIHGLCTAPRRQRKARYDAPLHMRQKYMGAPLVASLREKYNTRTVRIVVGDTVKVMRGDNSGITGKVEEVSLKDGIIKVNGAIVTKADGTEVMRPINPSNVVITNLNLKDDYRKEKINKKE
ncbi:MAG: 50S ribosomal protein L24 [Methanosarcinales archaeon]|nr:50S ribosomal protein L24 [Methanosarcinales archaeon]